MQEHDMYYNSSTGYFFDMKSSLYYHTSTGWLQYNTETNAYEAYVQPKPKSKWRKKARRNTAIRLFGDEHVKAMDQENVDVCETLFDLVDRVSFLGGEQTKSVRFAELGQFDELGEYIKLERPSRRQVESDDSEEEDSERSRRRLEEEESKYPPAVRLIDKTNMNNLYIVTIDGGTIGYSNKCDVQLKITDSVAEEHVQISYVDDAEDRHYEIECLKKKYCVYLDDQRITTKKKARLEHGCQMIIGPYRLEVHIHNGNNTCPDCEPGILNSKIKETIEHHSTFQERRMNHRQTMNSIKMQLGLDDTVDNRSTVNYHDRAAKRRKTVGSEPGVSSSSNIYGTCKAAPVQGASTNSVEMKAQSKTDILNPENKGFKLLKMMGWNEDTGLGKTNQGITTPIESTLKNDKKGLGSNQQQHKITISFKEKQKLDIIEKTRQRFDQAELEKRT